MLVNVVNINDESFGQINFNEPDKCPICQKSITPRAWHAFQGIKDTQVVLRCPDKNCRSIFVAYYDLSMTYIESKPYSVTERNFSKIIEDISEKFSKIYNQAQSAEILGLDEIAGPGYGKALEFLVKDYVIKQKPDEREVIEKEFLGDVIKTRLTNINVLAAAKRAAWLRNDESHYVRRWTSADISDLKNMIELVISWIELEMRTAQAMASMPEESKL
jgi:hypothetical protein